MRAASYQKFKSSWRAWQQHITKSDKPMGILWGDSEYLFFKSLQKTKQLFQSRGGLITQLDGQKQSSQFLGTKMLERSLFDGIKLMIISNAQKLDISGFVSSKGTKAMRFEPRHQGWLFCFPGVTRSQAKFRGILPKPCYEIVACALRPYELAAFSQDIAQSLGLRLTARAHESLRVSCGDKPYFMEQTLRKLALLKVDGVLDHHHLSDFVDTMPESTAFKILAHLSKGDEWQARMVLKDLLDHHTHPLAILGVLHHYLKQIAILSSEARGLGTGGSKKPLPGFLQREYAEAVRGVSQPVFAEALMMVAEADIHYKTRLSKASKGDELVGLVSHLAQFCESKKTKQRR